MCLLRMCMPIMEFHATVQKDEVDVCALIEDDLQVKKYQC